MIWLNSNRNTRSEILGPKICQSWRVLGPKNSLDFEKNLIINFYIIEPKKTHWKHLFAEIDINFVNCESSLMEQKKFLLFIGKNFNIRFFSKYDEF